MKKFLFLMILTTKAFSQEVEFGKVAVGLGIIEKGYISGKVYALGMENGEAMGFRALGVGYSVGQVNGITFTPIQLDMNHLGLAIDFEMKSKLSNAGISINYSF